MKDCCFGLQKKSWWNSIDLEILYGKFHCRLNLIDIDFLWTIHDEWKIIWDPKKSKRIFFFSNRCILSKITILLLSILVWIRSFFYFFSRDINKFGLQTLLELWKEGLDQLFTDKCRKQKIKVPRQREKTWKLKTSSKPGAICC